MYLEDGNNTVLGNVRNHPPGNSASHPKRPESLLTLLWEPWTWQVWWDFSFWSQCVPITVTTFLETWIRYARTVELFPVNYLKLFTLFYPVAADYTLITARKAVVSEYVTRFSLFILLMCYNYT